MDSTPCGPIASSCSVPLSCPFGFIHTYLCFLEGGAGSYRIRPDSGIPDILSTTLATGKGDYQILVGLERLCHLFRHLLGPGQGGMGVVWGTEYLETALIVGLIVVLTVWMRQQARLALSELDSRIAQAIQANLQEVFSQLQEGTFEGVEPPNVLQQAIQEIAVNALRTNFPVVTEARSRGAQGQFIEKPQ